MRGLGNHVLTMQVCKRRFTLIQAILDGAKPQIEGSWSAPLKKLLSDTWEKDPQKRPTMEELLARIEEHKAALWR